MLHLVDVGYVIHAAIELTDRAGPQDTIAKYHQSFLRRAAGGQCFCRPYLGTREFAASFALLGNSEPGPTPVSETRDLGLLFYDFDYRNLPPTPRFFPARIENGRLGIPAEGSLEIRA